MDEADPPTVLLKRGRNPLTSYDRVYSDEEFAFIRAVDHYKRVNRRPFPSWSEVLSVVHALGYRKDSPPARAGTGGSVNPIPPAPGD